MLRLPVHKYVLKCVYTYTHFFLLLVIYICTYIHTYTHTYTQTHTHSFYIFPINPFQYSSFFLYIPVTMLSFPVSSKDFLQFVLQGMSTSKGFTHFLFIRECLYSTSILEGQFSLIYNHQVSFFLSAFRPPFNEKSANNLIFCFPFHQDFCCF